MKKHLSSLLSLLLLLAILTIPWSQGKVAYAASLSIPVQPSSSAASQEDIKKLIETLESDTARKDLITSLKVLLSNQKEVQAEPAIPEVIPALTEQLGFRGKISAMMKDYNKFLDRNDISSSRLNQSLGTVIVLAAALMLLLMGRKISARAIRAIDKLSTQLGGIKLPRLSLYARLMQWILRVIIYGFGIYTISKIWEFNDISKFFEGSSMRGFLSSSLTTLLVVTVAVLIWESVGLYLAYALKQADDNNQTRTTTLLPMIRNVVMTFFGLLFALVIFSELGVNVAPLLAGAGVIGVAIGFGAQTMVKDFITGFTIVLEDVIRVGDVVTLDTCTGLVEKITLRKVQLRDFAGIVYTIPFSQISTIQNLTKNFSYYVLEVGVSYNQNTDRVIEVLKEVDADLRNDKKFGLMILEPIEISGVERFEESAVVIKARLKTQPVRQWDVGREYNRRMKIAFDKYGIEIPFPQRVVTVVNNGTPNPIDLSKIAKAAD